MPLDVDFSALGPAFEELSHEQAKEAANRAFSASQEALFRGGDEQEYDVQSVARSALPPQWDETEQGYVFSYVHPASAFFEFGTAPHEIEGDPVLAFPWPEMAGVEFADTGKTFDEIWEETWPTVFLPKVEVDGIERLAYVEQGMQAAERYLAGN